MELMDLKQEEKHEKPTTTNHRSENGRRPFGNSRLHSEDVELQSSEMGSVVVLTYSEFR